MQAFTRSQLPALAAISLGSAALGAFLTLALLRPAPVDPAADPAHVPAQAPAAGPAARPASGQTDRAAAPASLPGEADLPAELADPAGGSGLRLGVRHSRIQRHPDSAFYTLSAALTNSSANEIRKIRLLLDGLDASGAAVVSKTFDALGEHEARLRPGDSHVFHQLLPVPAGMVSCRLKPELLDQDVAATSYAPSTPLELQWPVETPANPPIEVRERSVSAEGNRLLDGVFVDVVLELRNTGTGALRKLELEQRYFAEDGTLLEKRSFLAPHGSTAPLLPGEVRLHRSIKQVPASYARYAIGVLKIE